MAVEYRGLARRRAPHWAVHGIRRHLGRCQVCPHHPTHARAAEVVHRQDQGADVPNVIHHKPATTADVGPDRLAQARRLCIQHEDLEEHGFTQNCPKCQHIIVHSPNTGTMTHSEQCRARLTAASSAPPAGLARIQKTLDRGDRYPAEHLRQHAEEGADQVQAGTGEAAHPSAPDSAPPPFSEFVLFISNEP